MSLSVTFVSACTVAQHPRARNHRTSGAAQANRAKWRYWATRAYMCAMDSPRRYARGIIAQAFAHRGEVARQRRFQLECSARVRMPHCHAFEVQEGTIQPVPQLEVAIARCIAVARIAQQRMAERREVSPHLVFAPLLGPHSQ